MKPVTLLALLVSLAACTKPAPRLPAYNTVAAFALTAHTGEKFDSSTLAGKVWVADFIFTTCTGPCPRMSSQMRQVQTAVAGLPDVKLVSFTVDPENDTPEALAAYAKRFQAEAGRWYFLTGPRETLHRLNRETFMLGNVDGTLDHSTRFVLIDRRGTVRGYYTSSEPASVQQLIADVRTLTLERS